MSRALLVLDSGNALFRNAGGASEADRRRAHFVLDVMGRLGTKAMAVGARDLSAGSQFLVAEGKSSGVRLLSANLRRKGKPVFEPSTGLKVGGLEVAVVGVSAPGPIAPNEAEVMAEPTVASVREALGKLGKRDLTVLLAATSWADAMQLAETFKGQVDRVIQSGEFRGTIPPQRVEGTDTFLLASGQKGQSMGKLELGWGSKGPVTDLSALERDRQQLELVRSQLGKIEARREANHDPAQQASLEATVAQFRARVDELAKTVTAADGARGGRTLKLDWVVFSAEVKDDEALKAEVLKIEPSYAGSH